MEDRRLNGMDHRCNMHAIGKTAGLMGWTTGEDHKHIGKDHREDRTPLPPLQQTNLTRITPFLLGRHHVQFFLKNKKTPCPILPEEHVLSAIKYSSFFAPSIPSTLHPAHALLHDDPAQSSATVTADSAPVDLISLSQPIDNITHHIVHSLSTSLAHEEKPHTVIFFDISHWHAMSEEEVNSDSGHEQAEDVRHIGAKMESPQSMAQMPNKMARPGGGTPAGQS
ncbi:hypothetical protein BDR07DRAFT_1378421 [Suillus spraguei]|nr:hypothetical protein BDR07DRAFT_1378421 [Suillus spraguei]